MLISNVSGHDITLIDLVTLTLHLLTSNKMATRTYPVPYYPPAKFGDDVFSGFASEC